MQRKLHSNKQKNFTCFFPQKEKTFSTDLYVFVYKEKLHFDSVHTGLLMIKVIKLPYFFICEHIRKFINCEIVIKRKFCMGKCQQNV